MTSVYKGVAHPWLCDVMGHMTTRHYVAMFDDASYHFLFEVFGWSGEQAKKDHIGWADVKHVIEYQAEVAEGDILEVVAEFKKLGTKSTTILYTMHNLSKREVASTLESTSVLFDLKARKAITIPEEMRAKTQSFTATDN
jgi:acyl-CoA thioester hydrolase